MSASFERVRRGKHWAIGKYVIARTRFWHDPDPLGEDGPPSEGEYIWKEELYPRDQWRCGVMHPKHPTSFSLETGLRSGCIAPSASFYRDLCKYGQFRWEKPEEQSQ